MQYINVSRWLNWCLLFLLLCAGTAQAEESARGRNQRLFVVPTPAGVTIDGDLSDWDKSGGIDSFMMPETRSVQAVRTYAMYDDHALYLAAEVKDVTPMMNAHDPDTDPQFAWDADAFQFRLFLKPTFPGNNAAPAAEIVHLLLWYYTDKQQPCLQLTYGMNYLPPKQGWKGGVAPQAFYQGAFRKDADGKGYCLEYRIPWSTLGDGVPPQAGDLTAATFQCHWGTPDGRHTLGVGGWVFDLMSRAGFGFQESGVWGKAIFSATGKLPAEVTQEGLQPLPAAPLPFTYTLPKDAVTSVALLDANSAPVRHLVSAQPRQAGEVTESWDGLDDKGDPLPAGTYRWKALTHNPLQVIWKLSVHNSGKPGYPTADGKGSWGADHGAPSCVATAGDRMVLGWEVGECGWAIIGTDLEGNKQWGGKWLCILLAADKDYAYFYGGMATLGVTRVRLTDGAQVKFGNRDQFCELPASAKSVSGLAVLGDKLYVACPDLGVIAEVGKESGALLRTIAIAATPGARSLLGNITPRGTDALYAVVGGTVMTVTLADGAVRPFVTPGMYLDDPQGLATDAVGNLYVANRGKRQCISVFSPKGIFLRAIGKVGGRPALGKWDGSGVLNPAGIAVDTRGHLWVMEANHSPKRQSVWDTKTGKLVKDFFGGSAYSTYVSMDPTDPSRVYCHGVQWKIDLDKGTWKPEAIVAPGAEYFTVMTAANGKQYGYDRFCAIYMRDGVAFRAVVSIGPDTNYAKEPWYETYRKAHPKPGSVIWSDVNGDGNVTPDELVPNPVKMGYWGGSVDAGLALYGAPQDNGHAYRLKPANILRSGVPIYDPARVDVFGVDTGYGNFAIGDAKLDTIYQIGGGNYRAKQFPGLNAYAGDGKHLWGSWTVGTDWNIALGSGIPPKGYAWGTTRWMGKGGRFLAALNYFGTIDIWDEDGLYVDKIYKDQRLGEMGPDVINAEFFAGQFVKTVKGGRYYLLAGDSDWRVNELLGLDSVRYLEGSYTLTKADVEKAAQARLSYQTQKTRAQSLVIERLAGLDWSVARTITCKLDDARQFRVAAAYDATNLVLRYDVSSPYELTNSMKDPQIIFKGGNCLDVELQTNDDADAKRTVAGLGDVRLIITRQEGKPAAMAYFKKLANPEGKPVTLSSPTGSETFDKVVAIPVDLQYERTKTGFIATVNIPLAAVGLTLKPAGALRLDVGYRYGNETGSQVAQRAYWSNISPLANIIYDIPSEVRMEPANWGTAVVE